jgi:hypothetical protein
MAVIRGGIQVQPWVQACADALEKATGADSFGTYPGHEPTPDRAMDCFVPVFTTPLGNAITAFLLDHWSEFGVRYMIFRQRIHWHGTHGYGDDWIPMEDRGSPTQNHFDHVHVSFETSASGTPDTPTPPATPIQEEEMFLYSTAKNVDLGSIWFNVTGISHRMETIEDVQALKNNGVPDFGERSAAFHNVFEHRG